MLINNAVIICSLLFTSLSFADVQTTKKILINTGTVGTVAFTASQLRLSFANSQRDVELSKLLKARKELYKKREIGSDIWRLEQDLTDHRTTQVEKSKIYLKIAELKKLTISEEAFNEALENGQRELDRAMAKPDSPTKWSIISRRLLYISILLQVAGISLDIYDDLQ